MSGVPLVGKHWFTRRSIMQKLEHARRAGSGAYTMEWSFAPGHCCHQATESVLAWCRETLSATRRPYGVAEFDLAIAICNGEAGPRSTRFLRVHPAEAYADEDGLYQRLVRFLAANGAPNAAAATSVAVALFSWGDAVHSTL